MEDWKVAQFANADDISYPEKPFVGEVEIDQQERAEREEERRSLGEYRERPSISHNHRLSIDLGALNNWDEQDAALRHSKEMAHTLMEKECAAEDVIRVWEAISKYITFKMMEGQAVRIAGLGIFTFRIHKTPMNQKSVKVRKAPIFQLSKQVAQMYRLEEDCHFTSNVPVVPLNLSVIAKEAKLLRGMIEGIVTEVLQAFARGIVCNKSLEFPFPFIGKLQIRNQKVTMKFYDEFCKKLGLNVTTTKTEEILYDNVIPGRMTPLHLHIPSDTFRSVFHLREVRSVHENSLLIPLVNENGKFIPETLRSTDEAEIKPPDASVVPQSEGEENENEGEDQCQSQDPDPKSKLTCSLKDKEIEKPPSMKTPFKPDPLYQPQKTGDCVLNLMNDCPQVMHQCLRAHMYQQFVDTLGTDVIKSHFHRRGNKGPTSSAFTYAELYPPSTDY